MPTEYIETRMIPLDDLVPYPGNARIGDRERIAESLDENGQYRSLVVRRTDDGEHVVLCGNNTLAALEQRGDDKVRCEIHRCDDATALRINLVDNALNDRATYDDRARAALIAQLDGDLAGSGYAGDEADEILARYAEPDSGDYAEAEEVSPPEEFPEVDETLPVEHTCPQCGYQFSGGK